MLKFPGNLHKTETNLLLGRSDPMYFVQSSDRILVIFRNSAAISWIFVDKVISEHRLT